MGSALYQHQVNPIMDVLRGFKERRKSIKINSSRSCRKRTKLESKLNHLGPAVVEPTSEVPTKMITSCLKPVLDFRLMVLLGRCWDPGHRLVFH